MATGRSFSSMSQTQIDWHCTKRALQKQQQKREKEEQLYAQLDIICQRQQDAHKRNRELLRDFRRIEQELALLTARTDTYRKNQENCKKQLQALLTRHCECPESSSDAKSHTNHTCNVLVNELTGTNNYVCKNCHLTASLDRAGQAPVNSSLCPNQHIESQAYCCIMCNRHFGSATSDEFKIPETTLETQTQKKKYPTNDSFYHRNCTLTCNTKGDRICQYPEVINNNFGPIKRRSLNTHVHGDSHQCIWNTNKYGIYREMGTQLRIIGYEVDQGSVRTSAEDNSREIPVLHQVVPSISENHQKSPASSTTSQYVQLSPSATHVYNRNNFKTASNSSQSILLGQLYDRSPDDETSEQNMLPHPFIKGQSFNSESDTDRLGVSLSLNAKSAYDGFEGGEVIIDSNQVNKDIKISRTNDNGNISEVSLQSRQELKMSKSSEEGSIREDTMTPESNSGSSISSKGLEKKEHSIVNGDTKCELGSLLVDHFFVKRDRKEGMMGLNEMEHENELSEESESQNEELDDDDDKAEDDKDDDHDNDVGEDDDDDDNENDDGEDDDVDSEDDDDHENVDNDENMEIINGNVGFTERKTSKNKMTKNIGRVIMGDKEIRGLYEVDREIKSNKKDQENKEKAESERSGHKIISIAVVGEGEHKLGKDRNDHESFPENISNEKGKRTSGKEDYGSQIVIIDVGTQQGKDEESCNTEVENETIITHKKRNKEETNTEEEHDISSKGEIEENADTSEEEESLCEYQDERDSLDDSEEEENTDFWGSKDDLEMEEKQARVSLERSHQEDASENIDIDKSTRKEESFHAQEPVVIPDKATLNSLNVMDDEHTDTERQRESQILEKRCSTEGSLNLPQMNPVESRSLLPGQEAPTSPTISRSTEADSIPETDAEDLKEELFHSENESEKPNQAWSDSEDNVHSFYD